MPTPRPPLRVHDSDGGCVVLAGPVVVFGPYEPGDLGMRNLGVVTLTQLGFAVGEVAAAFGIQPGYGSTLRKRFRDHGSAGLVAVSGRKAVLTPEVVATARGLLEEGWSQTQLAGRFGVGPSALSKALTRHPAPAPAGPAQSELEVWAGRVPPQQDCPDPDGIRDAASSPATDTDTDTTGPGVDTTTEEDTDTADDSIQDTAAQAEEADRVEGAEEAEGTEETQGADQAEEAEGEAGSVLAPRITDGVFATRYAGVMLAHAYLDRIGACGVLAGLPETPWRRFDQAQIACHTVLALLLGVGSIEQVRPCGGPRPGR